MYIFGGLSNCFVQARYAMGQGRGANISFEGTSLSDNTIVTSVSIRQAEKFATVACFDDVNHLYAFGHDAQNSVAQVTVLTNAEMPQGDRTGFRKAIQAYAEARLSTNKMVTLTVGGQTFRGRLPAMSSSTTNTQLNLQSVTYDIMLSEGPAGAQAKRKSPFGPYQSMGGAGLSDPGTAGSVAALSTNGTAGSVAQLSAL